MKNKVTLIAICLVPIALAAGIAAYFSAGIERQMYAGILFPISVAITLLGLKSIFDARNKKRIAQAIQQLEEIKKEPEPEKPKEDDVNVGKIFLSPNSIERLRKTEVLHLTQTDHEDLVFVRKDVAIDSAEKCAKKLFDEARLKEFILCAAVWYKDLEDKKVLKRLDALNATRPTNIDKGIVVCGFRHGHVMRTVLMMTGLRTVEIAEDAVGDHEQGFLTSKNRFVDRQEAYKIAHYQRQIIGPNKDREENEIGLTSEDLYSEDIY